MLLLLLLLLSQLRLLPPLHKLKLVAVLAGEFLLLVLVAEIEEKEEAVEEVVEGE
jgi:hypothetical protein